MLCTYFFLGNQKQILWFYIYTLKSLQKCCSVSQKMVITKRNIFFAIF